MDNTINNQVPDNNVPQNYYFPSQQPKKKTKASYPIASKDVISLVFIAIATFLTMRLGVFNGFNFGFTVTAIPLVVVPFIYVGNRTMRNPIYSFLCLIFSIVLLVSFSINNDGFINFLNIIAIITLMSFAFTGISGNVNTSESTYILVIDSICATFSAVFAKLPVTFRSLGDHIKKKNSKGLLYIILGAAFSLPLVCIVLPLLASSDVAFDSLVSVISDNLLVLIVTLVLTVFVAPAIFSYLFVLKNGACKKEKERKSAYGNLPPISINTFLSVLSLIYCVYLFSQLAYITKVFAFLLPENFSAAEFARSGFFQMCVITLINLLILILSLLFIKHKENGNIPLFTKLILTFLCLFTEFYITTAFLKMSKYISMYGLTRLRVLTCAFMVMLALVFVVLLFRLYIRKLPYMKFIVAVCAVTLISISVVDINTVISRHNYQAYKQGKIEIDVEQLGSMGVSSVPELVKLTRDKNKDVADAATYELLEISEKIYGDYFFEDVETRTLTPKKENIFQKNIAWNNARISLDKFINGNPDFDGNEFNEYYCEKMLSEAEN